MAQTKRRRRSKHRGTAAGTVEARGRTGRKPSRAESRPADRREARLTRLDRPPTWRGAATRAVVAAAIFLALAVLALGWDPVGALPVAAFTLVFYIPLGYYLDLFVYRRRQRRKAGGQGSGAPPKGRS